jgi:hypothetical protein
MREAGRGRIPGGSEPIVLKNRPHEPSPPFHLSPSAPKSPSTCNHMLPKPAQATTQPAQARAPSSDRPLTIPGRSWLARGSPIGLHDAAEILWGRKDRGRDCESEQPKEPRTTRRAKGVLLGSLLARWPIAVAAPRQEPQVRRPLHWPRCCQATCAGGGAAVHPNPVLVRDGSACRPSAGYQWRRPAQSNSEQPRAPVVGGVEGPNRQYTPYPRLHSLHRHGGFRLAGPGAARTKTCIR